jgi:hypothetical protein
LATRSRCLVHQPQTPDRRIALERVRKPDPEILEGRDRNGGRSDRVPVVAPVIVQVDHDLHATIGRRVEKLEHAAELGLRKALT